MCSSDLSAIIGGWLWAQGQDNTATGGGHCGYIGSIYNERTGVGGTITVWLSNVNGNDGLPVSYIQNNPYWSQTVLNSTPSAPYGTVAMGQIVVPLTAGDTMALTMNNTWQTSAWVQIYWCWYTSIAVT